MLWATQKFEHILDMSDSVISDKWYCVILKGRALDGDWSMCDGWKRWWPKGIMVWIVYLSLRVLKTETNNTSWTYNDVPTCLIDVWCSILCVFAWFHIFGVLSVLGISWITSPISKQQCTPQDPKLCLIGFCGRLCYQKGIHLILDRTEGWGIDRDRDEALMSHNNCELKLFCK